MEDSGRHDDRGAAHRSDHAVRSDQLHPGRLAAVEQDAVHGRVGQDGQVGAPAGRLQVGHGRRLADAVAHVVGRGADPSGSGTLRSSQRGSPSSPAAAMSAWTGRSAEPSGDSCDPGGAVRPDRGWAVAEVRVVLDGPERAAASPRTTRPHRRRRPGVEVAAMGRTTAMLLMADPPPSTRPDRSGNEEPSARSTSYIRTYGDSSTSSCWRLGSAMTRRHGPRIGPASTSRTRVPGPR